MNFVFPPIRVGGEGKRPARLMFVGEMPGIDEGRQRRPFVGKSGRELRRYLNGYELPDQDAVYLTNLSKTVAPTVKDMVVTDEDLEALWNEIRIVKPEIICTLGSHSTNYFLTGDWQGHDIALDTVHGMPHANVAHTLWSDARFTIWPTYNPAAMLHSPKLQSVFAYDMRRLGLHLRNKLPPPAVDNYPQEYKLAPDSDLFMYWGCPVLGMDTEGWVDRPWCVGVSGIPGTGIVVKADQRGELARLQTLLMLPETEAIVLHSAIHDLPVLRVMDVTIPPEKLHDTMSMAYLLGLEPQGLKALAYRHAGMAMNDYAELTADAAAIRYFSWLVTLHDTLPEPATKMTKRDALAAQTGSLFTPMDVVPYYDEAGNKGKGQWYDRRPLEGDDIERGKAKKLIRRMLDKGCTPELMKKWADGRAREILVDELMDLVGDKETDAEEPSLDEINQTDAVNYAGRDPDATLRVFEVLQPQIEALGLTDTYNVDRAIMPMIDRMQTVGLAVDVPYYKELSAFFRLEEDLNQGYIDDVAGRPLNPRSGDQVAELLYDELRLQEQVVNLKLKKTKGGRYSTNDKTLEALSKLHPIVPLIQDGREIRKLRSTYCDAIPRLLGSDGRLHPNYRITRTETGRLSASDPNVLALPKHSERGKLIRHGIIASPGNVLYEIDLSQIEMCMFAHDSGDPVLCGAIRAGLDLHYDTAARVILGLSIPLDATKAWYETHVTKKQRFAAKAVNFGILMGITAFGLLDQLHKNGQLHWTLEMCEELLAKWRAVYSVAWDYIQAKHREARRYGFVRDVFGRLRFLEGIHSTDDYIRAEAERMAQATPTQSGAQGIMKRIMRAAWPLIQELQRDYWLECLLQVHDALLFELEESARGILHETMHYVMCNTVELSVPIRAEGAFGYRMSELGE